ncbi:MAG: hypothetical protein ACYTE3_27835 [Planctomycetota bacterium]|jgi:hypothetical protein
MANHEKGGAWQNFVYLDGKTLAIFSPKRRILALFLHLLAFFQFFARQITRKKRPYPVSGQDICDIAIYTGFRLDMVVSEGCNA